MTTSELIPPRVRPGDTIAICAPSGRVSQKRMRAGVSVLEQRYRVKIDPNIYDVDGYLAGTDQRRAQEFNRYLSDPDVRAIIVARGGYGSMRILDSLDAEAFKRDPKLLVGFSDVTAILSWARTLGVRAIHGPVGCQLAELPEADLLWLFGLMESPDPPGKVPALLGGSNGARLGTNAQHGRIRGALTGGNLCILSHLIGTPYEQNFEDSIVLLEDVNERPYAIDRYLTHLSLAGAWKTTSAVVLGAFSNCQAATAESPSVEQVLYDRLSSFGIPVVHTQAFGHGTQNLALPLGGQCIVDFDEQTIELLDPPVQ